MSITLFVLLMVILSALIFEFINGFHDSANAIATIVSTRVLSPRNAIIFGASLEFLGAFFGTHVAKTISSGILTVEAPPQTLIICALLAAIMWNLITWYFGIPSSSSHALIGGLIGAGIAFKGINALHITGIIKKVIIPMFTSPVLGFFIGFFFMLLLVWLVHKRNPDRINKWFKKLQLISSGLMAFSHGSNDAQKTMGIITLALFSFGFLKSAEHIPVWVIVICAFTMSAGVMSGGWKIIRTMGSKVIKLKPIHGFAAETSAAIIILTCSSLGIPISTTHVISTAIMGVGSTLRLSAVKWSLVKNILSAWVMTIPICMTLAFILYSLLKNLEFLKG
ncbi:MAG: inorganic phosphate transporter [Candidatus Gastranaerophilales bacterium]|nr:inorganic phosphate transporter [Candidatus Gastranaerophilales bacterium]